MKLLTLEFVTKQVVYFGLVFYGPHFVKFIGTDRYGKVYGYSENPRTIGLDEFTQQPIRIAKVDLEGLDWHDSIVEVN